MPRKSRVESSTGVYHVVLRSVNQHIIFEEDADYQKFLHLLSDRMKAYDVDIYAYCLMDNHVHLLLHSSIENLPLFFQSLGTRFVRWYNTKYSRSGHLFQDRYHSVAIETSSQFLRTLVYIHNNPIRASVCRFLSEYDWSSYPAFLGQKNDIVNLSRAYEIAGSKEYLQRYFAETASLPEDPSFSSIHKPIKHYIPDEKALAVFYSITQLSSASEAISLPKKKRNEYICQLSQKGLTQKQIARFMDLSVATVKRALHK